MAFHARIACDIFGIMLNVLLVVICSNTLSSQVCAVLGVLVISQFLNLYFHVCDTLDDRRKTDRLSNDVAHLMAHQLQQCKLSQQPTHVQLDLSGSSSSDHVSIYIGSACK